MVFMYLTFAYTWKHGERQEVRKPMQYCLTERINHGPVA